MNSKSRCVLVTLAAGIAMASGSAVAQSREVAIPSLAPLVDSVKAAVVNVDVEKRQGEGRRAIIEHFRGEAPLNQGSGSGFLIDPKGLVVTNNHVISNALVISVRLSDGSEFAGEVIGRDPLTDVALVQLKGVKGTLPSVTLGDSEALRPGDWVMAIGNPFGLSQSVSAGIVSAMDRSISMSRYDQFLQTDAAINPGNSGGPLFNLKGEVVGMNTAILGGGTGIGFAVPSNVIKSLLPQLQRTGRVNRGYLGVSIQDATPAIARVLETPQGAVVLSVAPDSPAAHAGLKEDDVITGINGEKIVTAIALTRIVAMTPPESMVSLKVARGKAVREAQVKLGARPDLERVGDLQMPESSQEERKSQQRLGLGVRNFDDATAREIGLRPGGALVVSVTPGSAAERAGLQRGMVVIEVNRKAVKSKDDLVKAIRGQAAGVPMLLKVIDTNRDSARSLVAVELP